MMFGIGLPELIIIVIVALLVVGPTKLPEVARSVGRALGEFRRMADDVKDTFEQEMAVDGEKKAGGAGEAEKGMSVAGEAAAAAADPAVAKESAEAAGPAMHEEPRQGANPDTPKGA